MNGKMIRMGKESELSRDEVIDRAEAFFGLPGLGMEAVHREDCCARFRGAHGHVLVETADTDDSEGSSVTVQGRNREHAIREFMREI